MTVVSTVQHLHNSCSYVVFLWTSFWVFIAETAKTLINEDNARRGAIKVFEAVQNVQLNKHLFYVRRSDTVLDSV